MPILMIPGDYPQQAGEDGSGGIKESSIGLLLPDSFGPEDLEKPRVWLRQVYPVGMMSMKCKFVCKQVFLLVHFEIYLPLRIPFTASSLHHP